MSPQNICFAASEVAPFAKTGGLADVAAALPRHLGGQGTTSASSCPSTRQIDTAEHDFTAVDFLRQVTRRPGAPRLQLLGLRRPRTRAATSTSTSSTARSSTTAPAIYTGEWDEHLRFALFCRGGDRVLPAHGLGARRLPLQRLAHRADPALPPDGLRLGPAVRAHARRC